MASLTPLSKGLIGLAVVGAVASAVWHLGLKEWLSGMDAPQSSSSITVTAPPSASTAVTTAAPPSVANAPATPAVTPTAVASAPEKTVEVPPVNSSKAASVAHLSPAESSEMGRKFLDSGNYAQARVYLEQAVKGGDGAAACHLGEMTLKGQGGLPADQEKAASFFQMAQSKNIICFASGR